MGAFSGHCNISLHDGRHHRPADQVRPGAGQQGDQGYSAVADHAGTRVQKYYGANKCLYTLERFDAHGFNPVVHNKYVAERTRQAERNVKKAEALIGLIDEVRRRSKSFSYLWLPELTN